MINTQFTKIIIKNKSNFIFDYYKTKWKNIFIVNNNIWKLNIKWKDFKCNYDFTIQLQPLVPNIQIWFNPKTCKVKIDSELQQLLIKDNSKLYNKTNYTTYISNFFWSIYFWLFIFCFIFTLFIKIQTYVKKWKFINYKW